MAKEELEKKIAEELKSVDDMQYLLTIYSMLRLFKKGGN